LLSTVRYAQPCLLLLQASALYIVLSFYHSFSTRATFYIVTATHVRTLHIVCSQVCSPRAVLFYLLLYAVCCSRYILLSPTIRRVMLVLYSSISYYTPRAARAISFYLLLYDVCCSCYILLSPTIRRVLLVLYYSISFYTPCAARAIFFYLLLYTA